MPTYDLGKVRGEDGQPGKDGTNGKDGVSPSVSVTNITGGHRVSITDATGTKTFDVMDGKDGEGGGGASITLDTTLTQEGQAADAKAVGDAFTEFAQGVGELVQQTAGMIPNDNHINGLIDAKLGVIENGSY